MLWKWNQKAGKNKFHIVWINCYFGGSNLDVNRFIKFLFKHIMWCECLAFITCIFRLFILPECIVIFIHVQLYLKNKVFVKLIDWMMLSLDKNTWHSVLFYSLIFNARFVIPRKHKKHTVLIVLCNTILLLWFILASIIYLYMLVSLSLEYKPGSLKLELLLSEMSIPLAFHRNSFNNL